jgi:hypothetical protein
MKTENNELAIYLLLEKFENGEELYNTNPLFRQIIYMLAENATPFQVIEFIIKAHDLQTKSLVNEMDKKPHPINIIINNNIGKGDIKDFYHHYKNNNEFDENRCLNDKDILDLLDEFLIFVIEKQFK